MKVKQLGRANYIDFCHFVYRSCHVVRRAFRASRLRIECTKTVVNVYYDTNKSPLTTVPYNVGTIYTWCGSLVTKTVVHTAVISLAFNYQPTRFDRKYTSHQR